MQHSNFVCGNAVVKFSKFIGENNNGEINAIVSITDNYLTFQEQLAEIANAIKTFVGGLDACNYLPVASRIILSDASNQACDAVRAIKSVVGNAAVAYVEQAPMDYSKIAVLLYLVENAEVEKIDDYTVKFSKGEFTHFYSANIVSDIADTYAETNLQLAYLEKMLIENGLNIADNCVRTWFYVQNIDVNYGDVVRARRENFNEHNLTIDTHYITSTGICGRHASKDVTSILDAYSIGGLKSGQMNYLYAAENMNRTSDYGVTFERGSYVDFADRREIFVSGTASINNKGEIVAQGDIKAQTFRMIENVEELLKEALSNKSEIAHIVCYLRDSADYPIVSKIFEEQFPQIPYVITYASVCRPGWLIEMECVAISKRKTEFGEF